MITPSPTAPAGSVRTLGAYAPQDFSSDSVVLCRNNAPLVSHAFSAIRRDVPVRILGKELGQGLVKIIKAWKCTSWSDAYDKLDRWFEREVKKIKRPAHRAVLDDKRSCLQTIIQQTTSETDAIAKVERLFATAPEAGALTLSTGHKAKGREWDHVFILDQHLIPSKFATDLTQERNLLYVMVTRAKLTLTYIKSNCWKN